ncbi:MAG: PASTA domain-containing protein [Ignavibacteriae bacterium]|nr:PASTA domain-containing protein [Ignavibacteriota bacterium]
MARPLTRLAIFFGVVFLIFFVVDSYIMPRYVQQGKTTKVPNVLGLPLENAIQILADSGLIGKKAEERQDRQYPVGSVASQTPMPGAEVKFGRGVYLTISGGEPLAAVPSLRGRSVRDATFALERAGLRIGPIQYEISSDFPANTIIEQQIPESTMVALGTKVSVKVSQGGPKEQVVVPDVVRQPLTEGERRLLQAGLRIGNVVYQANPDLLPNTIVEQFPRAGEIVPAGQAVDMIVTRRADSGASNEN